MKHAQLIIIGVIIAVLGSLAWGYGTYLQQPYQGAAFYNPYTKNVLYPYKDVLVLIGFGIIFLGIVLAIGGGLWRYSVAQGQHQSILGHFISRRIIFYLAVLITVLVIGFLLYYFAPPMNIIIPE